MQQDHQQYIDLYASVTDQIIESLNRGTVPWRKPWTDAGIPHNLVSRAPYRGVNLWLLAMLGHGQNSFLTWHQLKTLGGSVRKGEKGQIILFWKPVERKVKKGAEGEIEIKKSVQRFYRVWNVAQCTGIPAHFIPAPANPCFNPIAECERIIGDMPTCPLIVHEEHAAFYNPAKDYVNMPKHDAFPTPGQYYGTLFHEIVHSTGHESRLKRKGVTGPILFGSPTYSFEELVAEIGACYLSSLTGIAVEFDQSAAYLNGWLKRLTEDNTLIVRAATAAEQAVDFILNVPRQESF